MAEDESDDSFDPTDDSPEEEGDDEMESDDEQRIRESRRAMALEHMSGGSLEPMSTPSRREVSAASPSSLPPSPPPPRITIYPSRISITPHHITGSPYQLPLVRSCLRHLPPSVIPYHLSPPSTSMG